MLWGFLNQNRSFSICIHDLFNMGWIIRKLLLLIKNVKVCVEWISRWQRPLEEKQIKLSKYPIKPWYFSVMVLAWWSFLPKFKRNVQLRNACFFGQRVKTKMLIKWLVQYSILNFMLWHLTCRKGEKNSASGNAGRNLHTLLFHKFDHCHVGYSTWSE